MAQELIVKKLQFPGSSDQYLINAHALEGKRLSDITGLIDALDEKVDTIAGFDALRYMGTIVAESTTPGGLTVEANKGDVYKVTGSGYVMGVKVEAGDMLICSVDKTGVATPSNYVSIANNWDIIQGNVDVEAILKHKHTGTVNFDKSDKLLSHTITLTLSDLTTSFSNGTASVTGNHGHTASGSVTLTPGGTVEITPITPVGTVQLTSPTTKGTNDVSITPGGDIVDSTTNFVTSVSVGGDHVHTHTGTANENGTAKVSGTVTIGTGTGTANYTPAGTIENASKKVITAVEGGDTTVSDHVASSDDAGGHTPTGTVTIDQITPGGTVDPHKHNVELEKTDGSKASFFNTVEYSGSGMDGVLTFKTADAVTSCDTYSVSEQEIAPDFTGAPITPTGTFKGDPVADHKHTINVQAHDAFIPVINVTTEDHSHAFKGTGVQLTASHKLNAAAHTHGVTVDANDGFEHTVTAPTETHKHTFNGTEFNVSATFTGTPADHNHTFTGADTTHAVAVTVKDFIGKFSGTAAGTVTPNLEKVVTDVAIDNHTIKTVDSGSFTTGDGTQE